MSCQVKTSGQCQLPDKKKKKKKNTNIFQLFHCQQTQSLLITLYVCIKLNSVAQKYSIFYFFVLYNLFLSFHFF
jgi:hypothetical protein